MKKVYIPIVIQYLVNSLLYRGKSLEYSIKILENYRKDLLKKRER